MARARITQKWADGSDTVVEMHVDPTFPDALDEARVQTLRMWRATCCSDETAEAETEDDPRLAGE